MYLNSRVGLGRFQLDWTSAKGPRAGRPGERIAEILAERLEPQRSRYSPFNGSPSARYPFSRLRPLTRAPRPGQSRILRQPAAATRRLRSARRSGHDAQVDVRLGRAPAAKTAPDLEKAATSSIKPFWCSSAALPQASGEVGVVALAIPASSADWGRAALYVQSRELRKPTSARRCPARASRERPAHCPSYPPAPSRRPHDLRIHQLEVGGARQLARGPLSSRSARSTPCSLMT